MEELVKVREEVKRSLSILSSASLIFSLSFSSELYLSIQKKLAEIGKEVQKAEKNSKVENKWKGSDAEEEGEGENDEEEEANKQLARTYFTTRQYQRVAPLLSLSQSLESRFLSLYSLFLMGERRKEEMAQSKGEGSAAPFAISNPNLSLLRKELFQLSLSLSPFLPTSSPSPFPSPPPSPSPSNRPWGGLLLYLFGVVLRNMGETEEAKKGILKEQLSYLSLFSLFCIYLNYFYKRCSRPYFCFHAIGVRGRTWPICRLNRMSHFASQCLHTG